MSIRKVLAIRKQFTVEQQQFVDEKKIDSEQTATQWIDFLEEIVEFDSYVDVAKSKTQNWAIGFGIASFLSIFSAAFLGGFAAVLVALFLILCLIYVAIYINLKKIDIPNRMRLFVFPLLRVLKEETKPDALIQVKADFKTGLHKPYLIKEEKKDIPRGKATIYYYNYPLLELKTKLADGNVLAINMTDTARKSDRKQSNSRGKTKYKTKYKIKTNLQVTLLVKTSAYQLKKSISPTANSKQDLHYALKNDKHALSLQKTIIGTTEETIPNLQETLALIAKGYDYLKAV